MQLLALRLALAALPAAIALLGFAPGAGAVVPFQDIASGGPLTHVYAGNELGCQVAYAGDTSFELYPPDTIPGDCGTFLSVAGTLYGPDLAQHGRSAASAGQTPVTPVSQSGVTGSGTQGDPFRVVTVVSAGATGVQITQTDSYVVGQESYRTDITVTNGSGAPLTSTLWRAGDCYLQESDQGFGFVDPANKAAGCALNANNSPPARIEQWYPITGGANYFEDSFSTVWSRIASQQAFADACMCTVRLDNGAGISWNVSLPAGGQATFSHYTTFSPRGIAGVPGATPPTGRPPTSVTQPRGSCARGAPNICINAPDDIRRFGCVRIGEFVHRFGIKLKKTRAGLIVNRVSRVTIVYFGLDRRASGADRKRPYFAFVDGRALTQGRHTLNADVRLKIPKFQQRRFPGRFRRTSYRKRLRFPFNTCPPGTGT